MRISSFNKKLKLRISPINFVVILTLCSVLFYGGYIYYTDKVIAKATNSALNSGAAADQTATNTVDATQTPEQIRAQLLNAFPKVIDLNELKAKDTGSYNKVMAYAAENDIPVVNNQMGSEQFIDTIMAEIKLTPIDKSTNSNTNNSASDDKGEVQGLGGLYRDYYTPDGTEAIGSTQETKNKQGYVSSCILDAAVEITSCKMPKYMDKWVGFKAKYEDSAGCIREGEIVMSPFSHDKIALAENLDPTPAQEAEYFNYDQTVVNTVGQVACNAEGKVLVEFNGLTTGAMYNIEEPGLVAMNRATDSDDPASQSLLNQQLYPTQGRPGDENVLGASTDFLADDFMKHRASDAPLNVKSSETPTVTTNVKLDNTRRPTAPARLPIGGHDTYSPFNNASSAVLGAISQTFAGRIFTSCGAAMQGYTYKCPVYSFTTWNNGETTTYNRDGAADDSINNILKQPDGATYLDETWSSVDEFEDAVAECYTNTGQTIAIKMHDEVGMPLTGKAMRLNNLLPPGLSNIFQDPQQLISLTLKDGVYIKTRPEDSTSGQLSALVSPEDDPILSCPN